MPLVNQSPQFFSATSTEVEVVLGIKSWSLPSLPMGAGGSGTVTVEFTEPVTGTPVVSVVAIRGDAANITLGSVTGSGATRSIPITVAADTYGEFQIKLEPGTVVSTADSTIALRTIDYSPNISYGEVPSVRGIVPTLPDVGIEVPVDLIRTLTFLVTLKFTIPIEDFVSSAITLSVGTLSNFAGEGDTYTFTVTLASNIHGQGTLTVAAETAKTEDGGMGPISDRVQSFGYDTRPQTFSNPVGSCAAEYNFDATSNPFVPGAGAFESCLEMIGVRHSNVDYIYAVLQLSEWGDSYDKEPFAPVLLGKQLDLDSQARAVLVKVNMSNCTWTVIKQYRFVSTAARSLHLKDNEVYWFEGSHYSYYNEGTFKEIENPDGPAYVKWIGDPEDVTENTPDETGRWIRKASPSNDGEYSVSGSTITLVTSRTSASYPEVRDNLNNNVRIFIGTTLVRLTGISLTNVNVNVARYTATVTVISGSLPAVDDQSVFNIILGNTREVFSTYRLRPLQVAADVSNEDWKAEIGHLYKVNASGTITDLGLNWLSSDLSEDPNRDKNRPYYEKDRVDRYYGVHGGIASPIVEDGNGNLHLITGYGDMDKVVDNTSEAARLGNWQHIVYADELNRRVPVLETNEKTAWDILLDTAVMTNSVIGFDKDTFVFQPRLPLQAKLSQAIPTQNYPSSSIHLKNPTRDTLPTSGTVLIDNEIFRYTGVSSGNLTPFSRAQEESAASAHAIDDKVYWVKHLLYWGRHTIDPMDRISIKSNTVNIFNRISVSYGNGKTYEVKDDTSIERYGLRELELTLPLGDEQRDIARYLAELYLSELQRPRQIVTLRLKLSLQIEILDTVLIREQHRMHLDTLLQVYEIDHRIFANETEITGVLIEGIA